MQSPHAVASCALRSSHESLHEPKCATVQAGLYAPLESKTLHTKAPTIPERSAGAFVLAIQPPPHSALKMHRVAAHILAQNAVAAQP